MKRKTVFLRPIQITGGEGGEPGEGGEICGHVGLVGGAMTLYPEQLILDHELCQIAHGMFQACDFQAEDMALEVIGEIGSRNDYLSHQHTVEHLRKLRVSPLLHPRPGKTTASGPREAAVEEYLRLDQDHRPEPLPADVLAELDKILAAADGQAEGKA